jgi:hypothetical protein
MPRPVFYRPEIAQSGPRLFHTHLFKPPLPPGAHGREGPALAIVS